MAPSLAPAVAPTRLRPPPLTTGRPQPAPGSRQSPTRRRNIRGYSHFVTLLKLVLPLTALGLVALVAAWPTLYDPRSQSPRLDHGQFEMVRGRYVGQDKQNRPFSVTAETASHSTSNRDMIDMAKPVAEITQTDGTWITITADQGHYHQPTGALLMLGNVHVLRDDGFEFFTSIAHMDTRNGTAWGDEHVDGQGPSGEITADGFRIYDHGRTVTFLKSPTAAVTGGGQKDRPNAAGTP